MRLKYRAKYIFSMVSVGCISLVLINFVLENNSHKIVEYNTSRIIIELPKKANVSDSKESVNDDGIRVRVPSTYDKSVSPVQPLPLPECNAPIVITPLT